MLIFCKQVLFGKPSEVRMIMNRALSILNKYLVWGLNTVASKYCSTAIISFDKSTQIKFFHLMLLTMSYVFFLTLYKMAYTSDILCYDCWAYIRIQFKSIDAFLAWRRASTAFLVVLQLVVWKWLIVFKGLFKMPLRVID